MESAGGLSPAGLGVRGLGQRDGEADEREDPRDTETTVNQVRFKFTGNPPRMIRIDS